MCSDLIQVGLKIGHLRIQLLAVLGQHSKELFELYAGVSRTVVKVNDLAGFGQRQSKPFY